GCIISGNAGEGISAGGILSGCRFIVTGSRITNNGSHGISANRTFNHPGVVVGNIIIGNGGTSVFLPDGSMVAANVISENGTNTPIPDNGNIVGGEQTGGGGVTDHGDLDGLDDDDHLQYLTEGRHAAIDHGI